jgi:PASTA domain
MRLNAFVPRLVVLAVVWLLATATLTLAAGERMSTPSTSATPPAAQKPAAPSVLVVPNVRGQAYVFAKGILEDGGFGWRVGAGAKGYPGNTVVGQTPSAGTRVVDTGAPRIVLTLTRHGAQQGLPDASSPYRATTIRLADAPKLTKTARVTAPTRAPLAAKPAAKPAVKTQPAAKPRPVAKPAVKPKPKPVVEPAAKPAFRKPDFVVPGVRAEPQNEIALPDRARALDRWLATGPKATNANVGRWLYQHSWIVTGAQYGWWHGTEALQILIGADRRAQSAWGIGARSEAVARQALAEVRARAR